MSLKRTYKKMRSGQTDVEMPEVSQKDVDKKVLKSQVVTEGKVLPMDVAESLSEADILTLEGIITFQIASF